MLHALGTVLTALGAWPQLKLVGAFLVGMLGSAAYITALIFKFIGASDDQRSILIDPFMDPLKYRAAHKLKCLWYCGIGGAIAIVFQFDVPNFVAVQSLILGATWPAIISQFLSGRMLNPSVAELAALEKGPEQLDDSIKTKLKELEGKISKL